jgi:hypothetical protein
MIPFSTVSPKAIVCVIEKTTKDITMKTRKEIRFILLLFIPDPPLF